MTHYGQQFQVTKTAIPGLLLCDIPVHGDNRGWFKENWQREKMVAAGLPNFNPVQNNVSFNDTVGTTRGIHAEPWDKFISLATGRAFGAWVDLRAGHSYGRVFTAELDPSKAVFVPRGVGNSYQTLEPNTAYSYLVNGHYSPDVKYVAINLADETIAVRWPIPLSRAEISTKDHAQPRLAEIAPIPAKKTLVLGSGGQLGTALRRHYSDHPQMEFVSRAEVDIAAVDLRELKPWREYDTIINAAAYTAVDAAETKSGRATAWATNVNGVSALARIAIESDLRLVHISSDYVFDGNSDKPYAEDEGMAPLSVYGQTKAAADAIVGTVPKHYIVRTSWVIGEGRNFVRTMRALAERGDSPTVVDDQFGRLTFSSELARATDHLIRTGAPYGTYNMTSSGKVTSWADIAEMVFTLSGHNADRIIRIGTKDYQAITPRQTARRPAYSVLDLRKIEATGFTCTDGSEALGRYLAS